MDFRQLRHFVAVVGCGQFSKAAEIVHITQPALTRSIQNLEHQVGVPLLLRQPGGIVPTQAGEMMLERANRILNDWVHTKSDILAHKERSEGSINVGITPLFSYGLMEKILRDFRRDHPTAAVTVLQGSYDEIRGYLLDGNCDVLLTTLPSDLADENLEFEPCLTIDAAILASAKHPLAQKENLTIDEIRSANWAMFCRSADHMSTHLTRNNIHVSSPKINTDSLSLLISLVSSGEYLTPLSPIVLINEISSGEIVILPMPRISSNRTGGLVRCRKRAKRPLVDAFSKSVTEIIKQNQKTLTPKVGNIE